MKTVGIRQLQQHASAVIRDVKAGEVVEITERGRVVARLVPAREERWDQLIAAGVLRPATADFAATLRAHPPLPADPTQPSLSEILRQMREDDDR